jgi:hypothetical protein
MKLIKNAIAAYRRWIHNYLETPVPGRMLPQPNREMRAYRVVSRILLLK